MKKNKVKKLLALSLGMTMLLSQTVYGSSVEEANQQEPITLTYGLLTSNYSGGDGIRTEEIPLFAEIEKQTGVTLDIITYDPEKFSLLVSSGDLPDILCLDNFNNIVPSMIESGQLLGLNDLLEKYGQNIQSNIPDALASAKAKGDGEIYYMPTGIIQMSASPARNGFIGLQTRYDIYKAIGSPEFNGDDEYLQVLKQMQDYQREQTGDDSIYALSSWTDWALWPYIIAYPFQHGLMSGLTSSYSYDLETGEFVSNFLDENSDFWNGIRFLNKAYRMGIFDPDGFVQKWSQYSEKISSGKILVSIDASQPDNQLCGEEAICVFLPGLPGNYVPGVYNTPYPFGAAYHNSRAISANCEYPERAMQVLDWLDSPDGIRTVVNGIKGTDWDVVDGEPQLIGECLQAFESGNGSQFRTENYLNISGMYSGNVALDDGYPVDLSSSEPFLISMATTAEKAFAQDYDSGLSYPGQVYEKWVEEGLVGTVTTDVGMLKAGLAPSVSNVSMQKDTEAGDYFMSNVSKVIMAESDEAFAAELQKIIDKFHEIGIDETWEEWKANQDEGFKLYEEIFNK